MNLSFFRNSISSVVAVPLRELSLRNSLNPGSTSGWAGPVSTNSNLLGSPEAILRFNTISIPKVVRSTSQDSISGSRKETQFSGDKLKTSVSRNSRRVTRNCSSLALHTAPRSVVGGRSRSVSVSWIISHLWLRVGD